MKIKGRKTKSKENGARKTRKRKEGGKQGCYFIIIRWRKAEKRREARKRIR